MPATIIGNNEWNQRGLVLTAQDAQEQVNGLVNVQATYVGPSSKHDIISRSFYQDAPPPIWPDVVNRSELVTNRLYMESRTVTRANGLTTVNASYVGGLQRAGFNGYFLRTTKETGGFGKAVPEGSVVQSISGGYYIVIGASPTGGTFAYNFRGSFIKHTLEYIEIGQAYSLKEPSLTFKDMFAPESATTIVSPIAEAPDPNVIFSFHSITFGGRLVKNGSYLPPKFIDRPNYLTPTVKVVEREYYF
jgi:hypothetical protein